MDDNERASIKELLILARMSIFALLVVGGYLNRDVMMGMV